MTHCACGNGAEQAIEAEGETELLPYYITTAAALAVEIPASLTVGCGRRERNQPAESHARGITNSDQPQSRQTRMSGEGVMGG